MLRGEQTTFEYNNYNVTQIPDSARGSHVNWEVYGAPLISKLKRVRCSFTYFNIAQCIEGVQ